ncbi:ABC transporter permease [Fodinisporobacter ferrooxydans]|uniref:Transport permease protein n=1 Tax=Fodinisporobacter ferrooxydans TaxID=2901836 RepID=A0ABY4CUC1_9BACL|nr:ABC transporter permease [Alicyclobacillaceae bacterium MYW30-H2]
MFYKFKEIYQYRQMLRSLILTDLRTRYKGSFLGFLWTFINPLLTLIVYTVIFSTIMRVNIAHYSMFMFVGLLPWIYFSTGLQNSAGSIIRQSNLVKKIYFPRIILPLATVGAALINYLLSLLIMIPALYTSGIFLKWIVIYFLLILLVETILTVSLSILISALNVYFRDLEHILGILLMVWFYFTPIIYVDKMIPEKYKMWFALNPLKPIIESYQNIFLYGVPPQLSSLTKIGLLSVIILIISILIFEKLQKWFAEEI